MTGTKRHMADAIPIDHLRAVLAELDRLRDPDAPPSTTLFPATLVVRATTGPPPA